MYSPYDIFEKDQQLNHDEIVPFSMSSKDMSLVDELPKLIELGIDSFKIEWYSRSDYRGPLGNGWHHAYDMGVVADTEEGRCV